MCFFFIFQHEMIHAYLWITESPEEEHHGPEFYRIMQNINTLAGTNITVRVECYFHGIYILIYTDINARWNQRRINPQMEINRR